MLRLPKISFLFIILILLTPITIVLASEFIVLTVYDGDTFKAKVYDVEIKVRLAGIDAPELSRKKSTPSQPFAQKSKQFLVEMILGKRVELKGYGIDPYNRQICEVFVNKLNVNLELVKLGFAQVYQGKHPINLDYSIYEEAQQKAIEERKGMWSQNEYITPKEWRYGKRNK